MPEVEQAKVMAGDWLRTDLCEYNWIAVYNDGTARAQYWEGEESTFGDIDQSKLAGFCLTDGPNMVGVDLNTGVFTINNVQLALDSQRDYEERRRLIYFRRHTQVFSFGEGQLDESILHCIGWQVTRHDDESDEPKCEKRILGVMNGMRIVLLEE